MNNDRKAMLVAAACFVHCIAGPVLLSFAGFASLSSASEKAEPVFILSSICLGAATLVPGYRKRHGRLSCLAMFVAGLFCLLGLRRLQWSLFPEILTISIGAALIIGAHALNLKFTRQCRCCQPDTETSPLTVQSGPHSAACDPFTRKS